MSEASGVAKISEDAIGAARAAFDQAVAAASGAQLEFGVVDDLAASERHLGLPDAREISDIQDELGCDVLTAVTEHGKRGGRKPGAKGRRSDDFAKWMLQFGPHPGVSLMRILARPTEMLAAEMSIKKGEALDRQIRAADILLPYFEGKKPIDLNVNMGGHMTLMMVGDGGEAVDGGVIEGEWAGEEDMLLPLPETAEKREFPGVDG